MNKKILIGILALLVVVLAGIIVWKVVAKNSAKQSPGVLDSGMDQVAGTNASAENELKISWKSPERSSETQGFLLKTNWYPENSAEVWEAGTVIEGKYVGGKVLLIVMPSEMGSGTFVRMIELDGKYYILGAYSPFSKEMAGKLDQYSFDSSVVSLDMESRLPGLSTPATLTDTVHNVTLHKVFDGTDSYAPLFFNSIFLQSVYADKNVGNVYTTADIVDSNNTFRGRGFYVKLADGTSAVYQMQIPFFSKDIPQITWTNGTKNTQEYSSTDRGGCGASNYLSIVPKTSLTLTDLIQTGTAANGNPIYEFKSQSNPYYLELLKNISFQDENGQYIQAGQVTPAYFAGKHPFLFWTDAYGRLIKFSKIAFQPIAECGKPVIYLYPTSEQKVSVKVDPKGGFSFTEPLYNGGWNVIAKPNGELTNIPDSKAYPYLFWEGKGGIYETPKNGWVIPQKEVHTFLVEKLTKLGLNAKERADFIEFWEPRMQGAPYYFVTFMGNSTMNQLAPLAVIPAPDTIIRILMDFQPLQKPITVKGFEIRTPERKGFTVVEWGGVLRK